MEHHHAHHNETEINHHHHHDGPDHGCFDPPGKPVHDHVHPELMAHGINDPSPFNPNVPSGPLMMTRPEHTMPNKDDLLNDNHNHVHHMEDGTDVVLVPDPKHDGAYNAYSVDGSGVHDYHGKGFTEDHGNWTCSWGELSDGRYHPMATGAMVPDHFKAHVHINDIIDTNQPHVHINDIIDTNQPHVHGAMVASEWGVDGRVDLDNHGHVNGGHVDIHWKGDL